VTSAVIAGSVLFDGDDNVLLAGFGYAAHHPARGQFFHGMIAVRILISSIIRFNGSYGFQYVSTL
jgi:hypothetical protein